MDIREKLVELLKRDPCPSTYLCDRNCNYADLERCFEERFADHLIAHGVTVQTVLCDNCSNFISVDDWNFCPYCGRWLTTPPKGE